MGALALVGCGGDDGDTGNLVGKWQNVYDDGQGGDPYITTYNINGTTVKYEDTYEATIENKPDFDAKYGVLIIKFTKYVVYDYSDFPNVTSYEDETKKDKYAALYWRDLTASTVKLADAWVTTVDESSGNSTSEHKMVDDMSTATTTFTNDTVSNFIDWSGVSPYDKK
jgi:hypothetical protein